MSPENRGFKTYSPEEIRLLAAEGRLKGHGVRSLVDLRPDTRQHRQVDRAAFESLVAYLPCWTEPLPLLRTFLDLIQISSPSGREAQVAAYLTDRLGSLGFRDPIQDAAGNLTASLPAASAGAPNLLFTAHMDCVYPGSSAPVQPVLCDSGEVRTDGSNSLGADDKAGIAAILSSLAYLRSAGLPHGEIRVLFTVQEELGFRGIKQIPASILNGIHLVLSMDAPVRMGRNETAHMAVLHMPPFHPTVQSAREAARDCGLSPRILFAEDGYVGGDTICLSPLGALIVDFCSCSRYPHTPNEHLRIRDLLDQTSWMIAVVERALALDTGELDLHTVYRHERIGDLIGVRKPLPLSEEVHREKLELARTVHTRPGPSMVPVLIHLSTLAPRLGEKDLLDAVISAYGRCLRVDQVPQVLRDLTASLIHLASNLGDVRPLEPLISAVREVIERGGDENARVNGILFLEELFQKERRAAVRARILRTLISYLQITSEAPAQAVIRFLRANLEDTVHALTVAFCNRDRAGWERATSPRVGRIVDGRDRRREEAARWTVLRQRILQLLLEEDRILPEMLEWIFSHDGAATQRIAVGFIDPERAPRLTARILHNLKNRQPDIQETAVQFVGNHRIAQAVTPLVDLLLTPYRCHNRSLVEQALDAIGEPALDEVVIRLGAEAEYAPLVRRIFNRHDRSTEADFSRLSARLQACYGADFGLDDPSQLTMLGTYIGRPDVERLDDLTRWDKRRGIVFYTHLSDLYPARHDLERLAELIEDVDEGVRTYFSQMAVQKNLFEDAEFTALILRENPRFLGHFVRLEKQIPRRILLSRLREFMAGAQLDMSDPQDVEIYYLYLLKQSTRMPDRTRYLTHIEQARRHLFPPVKSYCKAFTIAGDRIEEVGTVDRERVKALIAGLPQPEERENRLRSLLFSDALAKRERQRMINSLAEAFAVDVAPYNTLEERAEAALGGIDFEFDAAYRPVPQVVFPFLQRVRMKHRADALIAPQTEYAIEYALVNHPEIRDVFESGELDLILDSLNDLLTDRVYEAERDLSEDVFPELRDKHIAALSQFYTSQWKGIVRDLKRRFPDGRSAELIAGTEEAMLDYDVRDEDQADLLDTNLNRLVQTLRPQDPDLLAGHLRHRECYKVYAAVLRVRNIRQLKRIYREVHRVLQDEISFANRMQAKPGGGSSGGSLEGRTPAAPGYIKYARKELGKLNKLMGDFALERALKDRVDAVQAEITKLRQVVVGTSQILCVPSKDVSIVYRSWPGNDCNMGDIQQVLCPDGSFYKIISGGAWKGYFTLVEIHRRNERALLLDVLNYSGLGMENERFMKVLMHRIIQTAQAEGMGYVLTSGYDIHISNRDYIRRAFRKAFPSLGTVQGFGLTATPAAHFQSLVPNLSVVWKNENT